MIPSLVFLFILLLVFPLAALLYGLVFFTPRTFKRSPDNVLILAAHPDDCVIMAGEYAIWAADAGRQIRVVYLTCGDRQTNTSRAKQRRREAIEAWKLLKVQTDQFYFFDNPNSEIDGPLAIDHVQALQARDKLVEIMRTQPSSTAIFIPAEGELHPDHRALRQIGLEAWNLVQRSDLQLYEVSEYNAFYSLLRCPLKTFDYIAKSLPLLGRWYGKKGPHIRQDAFIQGGPAFRLPPNEKRMQMKCELLKEFRSENSELLVRYFGHPDIFRPIPAMSESNIQTGLGYLKVKSRYLGLSVISFWLALYLFLFFIGALFADWLHLPLLASGLAGLLIIGVSFRAMELERQGLYVALGVGLLSNIFAIH